METDPCDEDYLLGTEGTDNCTEAFHKQVLDREKCLIAATKHNAKTLSSDFTISESMDYRPQGCFKAACSEHSTAADNDGDCYFFNPVGYDPPHGLTGTPVCMRPKISLGTNHSSTCQRPDDYSLIMSEDTCKEVAACLNYDIGGEYPEFNVNQFNNSKYDDYPKGCFIMETALNGNADGRVFFNGPPQNWPRELPAQPTGTPICAIGGTSAAGDTAAAATDTTGR